MMPGIQSNHDSTYHIMDNLHYSDGSGQKHTSTNQAVLLLSINPTIAYTKIHNDKTNIHPQFKDQKYDSDSYLIGIKNHVSASMTNSEDDFIIKPTPIDLKIK
jgi:hypothetical protein